VADKVNNNGDWEDGSGSAVADPSTAIVELSGVVLDISPCG